MSPRPVTKYPLLRPALAMVCGILFASVAPVEWRAAFAITALLGVLAVWRPRLNIGFWLFLGASLLSFRYEARDPNDLRNIFNGEPELVTLSGTLSVDPERRVLDNDGDTKYRTTARLTVREITRGDSSSKASGEIAVSTTGYLADDFIAGADVEIFGILSAPQGATAPGLFEYEKYLKWQRVFFVLRAESSNDWKLVRPAEGFHAAAWYRTFNDWARRTLQRGIPEDENTRLLWAMALGWKPGLTNEISEPFMRTGTLHVFAISGLHIAMIAGMLVGFQRGLWFPKWFTDCWYSLLPNVRLGLTRVQAGVVTLFVIWWYTAATGWQASAVRSTIMSSVIICGWFWKRPSNLLNSLAAAALLILLWQPEQLFQIGFQLSFLLLISIAIWPGMGPHAPWHALPIHLGWREPTEFEFKPQVNSWTRILAEIYRRCTGHDSLLPPDLRPKESSRWDGPTSWTLGGFNMSIAALLGSLPITALYFNLISWSSLLANLLIVPASGIALGGSLLSLVLAPLPFASEIANFVSWQTMKSMVAICRFFETYRWSYDYVSAPTAFSIGVYYLALLALIKGLLKRPAVAASICALVTIAILNFLRVETATTQITILPGSGVTFVDAPWSKNDLLIDCGREREAELIVTRFLRSRGVDRLENVLLTHGDVSHVEGYAHLSDEFGINMTHTGRARSRSPKYREILRKLEQAPGQSRKLSTGDSVAGWNVLHPSQEMDFSRADDETIVLRRELEGRGILLLSELGRRGQQALLNQNLRSHIVIGGLPTGANDLARPEFLEPIAPQLFILAGNDAKLPRAERELRQRFPRVLSTQADRAITITARRGEVTVETMTGLRLPIAR